jgi:hypothetical protein
MLWHHRFLFWSREIITFLLESADFADTHFNSHQFNTKKTLLTKVLLSLVGLSPPNDFRYQIWRFLAMSLLDIQIVSDSPQQPSSKVLEFSFRHPTSLESREVLTWTMDWQMTNALMLTRNQHVASDIIVSLKYSCNNIYIAYFNVL